MEIEARVKTVETVGQEAQAAHRARLAAAEGLKGHSGPVVERVVVGADQATLEGQGRPGFSLLLSLGDTTNRWECGFPYDTRFTAMFKRATRHGFSWTVSDRAGKALFATTVPQFEGEDFKQGVIVFREGTLAPEPDGSLVIAWLELGNGGLIPMSVRLEKDGKSAGMSSYSPVIERIVQEGIRAKSALDLDTGEIIDGPGVLVSPKQLETWMFDSGMDLLGVVSSGAHGLTGFEMVVMPVERGHWDMPAAKVQEVLATKAPLTRAAMTRLGGLPATYLFKTRERGMGVLQIVDFTNNPSAVKIRYKLVQATGSTSAGPPQTNASRTFPLRHILASEMTDDLRQILLGKPAMEARPAPDNLQLAVTNALLRTRWSLGPTEPLVGQLNIAPEQLRQLQAISPATDIPIESVDRQELSALFNDYLSATDKPAVEKALVEAIVALDAKYSDRTMELVDTAPQVRQIFTEEQWAGPSRRFGN